MVAWLHTVLFLRIQIYTKTQEKPCIFWNRRIKLKYLFMSAFGLPKSVLHYRENSLFCHFVNFSFEIMGKWHDMMINNELWRAPTAISFKYIKDLQTLKAWNLAWNGRNMYDNLNCIQFYRWSVCDLSCRWTVSISVGVGSSGKIFSTMLLHLWFPLYYWYSTWTCSEKVEFWPHPQNKSTWTSSRS